MEQFFKPARRNQDRWESSRHSRARNARHREFNEVELAIPVEEFLSYQWDWKDLFAFVSCDAVRKFIWISKDAFLSIQETRPYFSFHFSTNSDRMTATIQETSGQEQCLILAHLDHPGISLGEAGIFWRAITTSNCVQLRIGNANRGVGVGLPSGPLLSKFLRESPSLQVLELRMFDFEEEHCRALAALERTDIKITLNCSTLEPQDAEDTFIEWFRHNKVITHLDCCQMGSRILSALSGNNSVKRLTIDRDNSNFGEDEIHSLLQALPGNMGIEHLDLRSFEFSDENWILLFRSLSTHSRMNRVDIHDKWFAVPTLLSAASKTKRLNAIIQMLHLNTVVDAIDLADHYRDEEMYQNFIVPRLLMNFRWFEAQCQAVKRADPSIRPQLLGRALHVVRYNPELVWQFLSENIPTLVLTQE
jgi:hypothetical protein